MFLRGNLQVEVMICYTYLVLCCDMMLWRDVIGRNDVGDEDDDDDDEDDTDDIC